MWKWTGRALNNNNNVLYLSPWVNCLRAPRQWPVGELAPLQLSVHTSYLAHPEHQVNKTKHSHMYSMCRVNCKKPFFAWTIAPFQFIIQKLFIFLFLSLSVTSFCSHGLSFAIFPRNRHHSITFTMQRTCQSFSLSTKPFYSSSFCLFLSNSSFPVSLEPQQGVRGDR